MPYKDRICIAFDTASGKFWVSINNCAWQSTDGLAAPVAIGVVTLGRTP